MTIDPHILQAALVGLEHQKARIDEHIASIRSQLGKRGPGRPPAAVTAQSPPTAPVKRGGMSAAGRKAIAEAQRKRWAAIHQAEEKAPAPAAKPRRRKRKLSAEGRANIVAALKKRWAAKNAPPKQAVVKAKKVSAKKPKAAKPAATETPAPAE